MTAGGLTYQTVELMVYCQRGGIWSEDWVLDMSFSDCARYKRRISFLLYTVTTHLGRELAKPVVSRLVVGVKWSYSKSNASIHFRPGLRICESICTTWFNQLGVFLPSRPSRPSDSWLSVSGMLPVPAE
jgi:hypothetical protein